MKKNLFKVLSLTVAGALAFSCSSPSKMAKDAENLSVECNPEVLEVVADQVNVSYTINFPEGYFHPKAILEVVPVVVYDGGEVAGKAVKYQGEKVTDNYKVIAKDGASVTETASFNYVKGFEKSHLELRLAVYNKDKKTAFEQPIKVADGANTTYMLADRSGFAAYADHGYQKVIREQKCAQILYLINNATVRPSQLTTDEIKDFKKFLKDLKEDERREYVGTDLIAYASPDGKEDNNAKLSQRREQTAVNAFKKIVRKSVAEKAPVNAVSVAEDWEGFKELVEKSDLEDKDLIIRVLSMYEDPAVREAEIKNMSNVYKTIADKILPQLRRARFIANIDFTNYSEEELVALVSENIEILDEPALLYAATLFEDADTKMMLYRKAGEKFNSSAAYVNLAAVCLENNKVADAKAALKKASCNCDEYNNNMGAVALAEGDLKTASEYFAKSAVKEAEYNLGTVAILSGDYKAAAESLAGSESFNEALANVLVGNYDAASKILNCECPAHSYLRAVIAARTGNEAAVESELAKAAKCDALKARSESDIEFAKYRK